MKSEVVDTMKLSSEDVFITLGHQATLSYVFQNKLKDFENKYLEALKKNNIACNAINKLLEILTFKEDQTKEEILKSTKLALEIVKKAKIELEFKFETVEYKAAWTKIKTEEELSLAK